MRRYMLLLIAVIVPTAGCTNTGGFSGPGAGGIATQGMPPNQWVAGSQPGMQPQVAPSATQRLTAAVTDNPLTRMISPGNTTAGMPNNTASSQPAQGMNKPPNLDPISLGYPTGPPNPQLYISMAEVSERTGNDTQARLMYQKAIAIDPNNLAALLGSARLEDRLGQLGAAQKKYKQAATAHPDNPTALNDLALCYARQGDLQSSLGLLEKVVQLQPKKPLYRNNIAKVLLELNRENEALTHLAEVYPPAIANYNLGFLLSQRERKAEAIQYLTLATKIDSQMEPAQALLAQLSQPTTQIAQRTNAPATTSARPPVVAQQPTNAVAGIASGQHASSDSVLPTPYGPIPSVAGNNQPGTVAPVMPPTYPATGVPPVVTLPAAQPQELPAITSPLPVESAPLLLPPVQ